MFRYIVKRVLISVPTLWAVVSISYLMLHATPGGPFDSERQVPEAVLANLKAKYHLDQPLWKQYLYYLNSLLHGDLGASFRYADWSVNQLLANALPVSASVAGVAVVFSVLIGVFLGTVAALKQNSIIDYFLMFVSNIGLVVPSFVIGPVLILIFSVWLRWLPAGGWEGLGSFKYMVLPIGLLVFVNSGSLGRVMRGSLIEVMNSPFIRTARAKGLPLTTIVMRHAFKPALIPVVTLIGPMMVATVTSAVVTETVFSLPGVGRLIVNGASNRDYTLVLGLVVLITLFTVVFNLLVDIAYAYLDPRIRYQLLRP